MSKGAPPERGWVVEIRAFKGDWVMLEWHFTHSRSDAIDSYLGATGLPEGTCLACHWREQQRNGKARCVRVVLQEEE